MIDWTDRHCRYFHRLMSRRVRLYTEMVVAVALVKGGARHLLTYHPDEHPVALQLGGSDPRELAEAARIGAHAGYDEINLNVGCPSDRVQSGTFGAVLMRSPAQVGDCVAAMIAASSVDVTVKCRLGVDDQKPSETLPIFLETIQAAGVRRVIIHARKAWLEGLSPKENREIPPLDYSLVHEMVEAFPDLTIDVNGGIESLDAVEAQLAAGVAGVMVGRAAYHNPAAILLDADRRIFGDADAPVQDPVEIARAMIPYAAQHIAKGGKLHAVTRHMLGLFTGKPGARAWRRTLSEGASRPDAGPALIEAALAHVDLASVRLSA